MSEMVKVDFQGLTVATFESRMATEISRLIERYGGRPLVAPVLREIPLGDNSIVHEFGARLMAGRIDLLILLTGIGATTLFDLLKTRYPWPTVLTALQRCTIVARGPKPVAALKAAGLQATLTVPEPNTWIDLISTLDKHRPVKELRVAVQEYGISNPDLLRALEQRGAEVFPVPIYKWALLEDLAPIRHALDEIMAAVRSTPITLLTRKNLAVWTALAKTADPQSVRISTRFIEDDSLVTISHR
ncbi:MAG: uroporphyrinogen-III synthase [Nitrospira sp.]|nr:MAG: uroporphyrinogen-III synthase [Nitrospira sp.]